MMQKQPEVYQTKLFCSNTVRGTPCKLFRAINYNISMSLSDLPYDVLSIIAMRMTSTVRDRRCSLMTCAEFSRVWIDRNYDYLT
jgi:hypothetical protein